MTQLNVLFRRNFTFSLSIHQCLGASSSFSLLLLIIRIVATHELTYVFLPWNLLLAYLPYAITRSLLRRINITKEKIKLLCVLLIWILFVPNSFYILTDLFHLGEIDGAPKWFDLLLIFSFAWNGLLFGIISIRRVELIVQTIKTRLHSFVVIYLVMWLNAFGIYIGRYLRYNSWDVLTNPFPLASEIIHMVLHPVHFNHVWGMSICYSIFMTFLYFTIKKMSASFSIAAKI